MYNFHIRLLVTICEDDTHRLRCPDDKLLHLKSVFWGRDNHETCSRPHVGSTTCSDESAVSKARDRCEGKGSCVVGANRWTFGDPCPDTSKFLRIEYECTRIMKGEVF